MTVNTTTISRVLAAAGTAAALSFSVAPATAAPAEAPASAAEQSAEQNAATCPKAEDLTLTAPSHTEAGGNLLDKQITYGAYWAGGNVPAGTQMTLTAGPATVTLQNGKTYEAPVAAGGTISGVFPNGGAALAPSFKLQDSSAKSAGGPTNGSNVKEISYPVTAVGNFGSCTYTVHGTSTSAVNVTSLDLT